MFAVIDTQDRIMTKIKGFYGVDVDVQTIKLL